MSGTCFWLYPFCFVWRLFHAYYCTTEIMNKKTLQNSVFSFFHSFFVSGSVCQRADYGSYDPLWLVSGLTRAVGQERWPRCGSYPALKSILEGHAEEVRFPKHTAALQEHWLWASQTDKIPANHKCTVQTGTLKQYLEGWDVIADLCRVWRQIQTAWCKHS